MSLFRFLQKKDKPTSNNNKQLENEISILYNAKKYDEVISKVITLSDVEQEVSLKNKQMLALSYFYKTNYVDSLAVFKEIAKKKNDVESWFNCLNPLLLLKKMQEAKEVFTIILKLHKGLNTQQPRELGLPFIRYYYAWGLNDAGLFEEALEQLEELKKVYIALRITDDTFVYIRGVPFISNTLDLAKKVFAGLGTDLAKSNYLRELKSKVDDNGKILIKAYEN